MPITLNHNSLFSRGVRLQVGDRLGGAVGGLIERVTQAGKTLVKYLTWGNLKGFLVGAVLAQIPSMLWSLTGLWEMFTSAAIELYYFDWNTPDSQLDQQARQQWSSFGSQLGGTAGQAIGFFACGIVPATSLMAFDERLALYVLREVGEEAFEELSAQFSAALRLSIRNLGRQTVNWLYKGARRWLKDPNNIVGQLMFGSRFTEVRQKWGESNSESWSFAQAVENRVEKIPSQFWENFTEELIEEAIDSCIEAGYVVAQSIEGYMAQQKLSQIQTQEAKRVIEVQPNKDNDAETFVLAGPESEVRGQLPHLLATHQMLEARDVGQIVGQPLDDYVRPRPFDGLRLQFKLFNLKSPPYAKRGSQRLVEVSVQISDVDRAKLDWDRLVAVCGGRNGYLWGRFRAHAILDNGHPLTCYGGTPDEAEDRLRAFLTLSTAEIKTISITEEKKEAERLRNPKLFKETTRIYPAYCTIINRERTLSFDLGRRSRDGNYIDKRARIDLWRMTKPADYEDVVRELLRRADLAGTLSP